MQLFATHECPRDSALALDDARVVNQCRETAQLVCTVLHARGVEAPYRSTHPHHPVTKWAMTDLDNLAWVVDHLRALRDEHLHRYPDSSEHRSASLVLPVAEAAMHVFMAREGHLTGMPSTFCNAAANASEGLDFKHLPAHEAYREYLKARWLTQRRRPTWTRRGQPDWLTGRTSP